MSGANVFVGIMGVTAIALAALVFGLVRQYPDGSVGDFVYLAGWYLIKPLDGSALYQGHGMHYPPSLAEKNVVITGGSRGIGFEAARWFQALGANVIISGKTQQRAEKSAKEIKVAVEGTGLCLGLPLDLADFNQTRRFAVAVAKQLSSLDYLLLNAGATHDNTRKQDDRAEWVSKSGHNRLIASNHLGHYLLTMLLAPMLSPNATVVVVSSLVVWSANPQGLALYKTEASGATRGIAPAYAVSKLANLCFARSLRQKLQLRNITVVAMTPGQVATELQRENRNKGASAARGGEKLFESTFVSARPQVDFVYPFWYPSLVFGRDAALELAPARMRDQAYYWRPQKFQTWDFNLHASVGPDCGHHQRDLWLWSREAVGLPPRYDDGDLFQAAPGMPAPPKFMPKKKPPAAQKQKPKGQKGKPGGPAAKPGGGAAKPGAEGAAKPQPPKGAAKQQPKGPAAKPKGKGPAKPKAKVS